MRNINHNEGRMLSLIALFTTNVHRSDYYQLLGRNVVYYKGVVSAFFSVGRKLI